LFLQCENIVLLNFLNEVKLQSLILSRIVVNMYRIQPQSLMQGHQKPVCRRPRSQLWTFFKPWSYFFFFQVNHQF